MPSTSHRAIIRAVKHTTQRLSPSLHGRNPEFAPNPCQLTMLKYFQGSNGTPSPACLVLQLFLLWASIVPKHRRQELVGSTPSASSLAYLSPFPIPLATSRHYPASL